MNVSSIFSMIRQILIYTFALVLLRLISNRIKSFKAKEGLFLAASYLFYFTWGAWFLAILIFSSLMNYALGSYLRRQTTPSRLWLGIALNIVFLSFFKYLPSAGIVFVANPVVARLAYIVLPVGMSFWTFQALSYLLDIYRGEELDPTLLEFCLYMAFWPTVLSGPICRLTSMLPQFRQAEVFSWREIGAGTQRMLMGVMMMVLSQIMADGLAPGQGVDAGFDTAAKLLSGTDAWCLAIGYGFQLFFNFAGYSHLVIGAAQVFNIQLHENFKRPYLSTTPSMFWTRWHMSLSFWIRDYVFFPLATLRSELWWRNFSLVIAMFVFGLWHKGSVLYMVWGIYHGLLLVLHRQWQRLEGRWKLPVPELFLAPLSWCFTFAAVSLGWIFFRAESGHQAATLFRAVLSPASYLHHSLPANFYRLCIVAMLGYFAVVGIAAFLDRYALVGGAKASDNSVAGAPRRSTRVLELLARERLVWSIPIVLVLSMYFFLVLHPEGPQVAPMMYQIF
ncbi:MAG: MBOAT family protein [Acidipila sp.]|nr:MBOAT family protein [Acidipila sp.]